MLCQGCPTVGVSAPHWKRSRTLRTLRPMSTHTQKCHDVLSKFTIWCWAAFVAILGCTQPVGCRLDTPAAAAVAAGIALNFSAWRSSGGSWSSKATQAARGQQTSLGCRHVPATCSVWTFDFIVFFSVEYSILGYASWLFLTSVNW